MSILFSIFFYKFPCLSSMFRLGRNFHYFSQVLGSDTQFYNSGFWFLWCFKWSFSSSKSRIFSFIRCCFSTWSSSLTLFNEFRSPFSFRVSNSANRTSRLASRNAIFSMLAALTNDITSRKSSLMFVKLSLIYDWKILNVFFLIS